jgi:hypothetical protein
MPALIASAGVCIVPAAAELTPRPYALFPTRLLEFMACRRAVVAPRRGSVAMLIDHGREGLLFTPGDHIDLARKLRRLIDDPGLRDRLAANGYERVRRECTASAARRAIRNAYVELADRPEWRHRFAEHTTGDHSFPEAIAVGDPIAADDEFEATVYEVAPTTADPHDASGDPSLDGALERMGPPTGTGHDLTRARTEDSSELDSALATLDADSRIDQPFTEERVVADVHSGRRREVRHELSNHDLSKDELTHERTADGDSDVIVAAPRGFTVIDASDDAPSSEYRVSRLGERMAKVRGRRLGDEWVVRHPGRRRRRLADDGTPIDTVPAPATGSIEAGTFVAGEIDVPTPTPELIDPSLEDEVFTAAASLLGSKEPDTGV